MQTVKINENCVICGSDDYILLSKSRLGYTYDLIKCRDCHLVTIHPKMTEEQLAPLYNSPVHALNAIPPKDLKKANKRIEQLKTPLRRAVLYEKGYFKNNTGSSPKRFWGPALKPFMLKRIIGFHGEGRILDVGCNNGLYLYILKSIGWDVYGLELNKEGAKAAMSLGVKCFSGYLEEARYPDNFFDVIRIYHVLEHVVAPQELMAEIRRILKPDGIVYLEVPNQASFSFYAFKHVWHGKGAHLHAFSPSTFKRLCDKVGLEVKKVHIQASAGKLCTDLAIWSRKNNGLAKIISPKIVSNKLFKSLIIVPFCLVLNLLGLGDRYAAELGKK